jgi:hypothetical protein
VAGVAGGSMLRARKHKVYGVGPRSAHIAGLPYACFLPAADLAGAEAVTIAPRPGDHDDYLVLRLTPPDRRPAGRPHQDLRRQRPRHR